MLINLLHRYTPSTMAILTVFLDRCENLCDKDLIGKSDPYVKFELEQDNFLLDKDFGERKSSVKKDALSPVYGETFTFTLPDDIGLKNMVLKIKVMDDDPLHDDKLGSAKIKLENLSLNATPKPVEAVVDKNLFTKDGKIFLKLSYKK